MVDCWNAFCVPTDCDGIAHVDSTGHSWNQAKGMAYNPATGVYDLPDTHIMNGVWTNYRRN